MDEETERFQVAIAECDDRVLAVLVDSATGRSWWSRAGTDGPATWYPFAFAADAPAAPAPPGAEPARPARRPPAKKARATKARRTR